MSVRSTMAALIARVRSLISDPSSLSQVWDDQTLQDVLDASRVDVVNGVMTPLPTFTGASVQYLNYYVQYGDWEDDLVLKQYLTTVVTPSVSEPIAGHWAFATTTLPPVYITGKTYDVYKASSDILERWAAKWVLSYDFTSDGQSFRRSQASDALQKLALSYRRQQRATTTQLVRGDLVDNASQVNLGLGPIPLDYYASGDGR